MLKNLIDTAVTIEFSFDKTNKKGVFSVKVVNIKEGKMETALYKAALAQVGAQINTFNEK